MEARRTCSSFVLADCGQPFELRQMAHLLALDAALARVGRSPCRSSSRPAGMGTVGDRRGRRGSISVLSCLRQLGFFPFSAADDRPCLIACASRCHSSSAFGRHKPGAQRWCSRLPSQAASSRNNSFSARGSGEHVWKRRNMRWSASGSGETRPNARWSSQACTAARSTRWQPTNNPLGPDTRRLPRRHDPAACGWVTNRILRSIRRANLRSTKSVSEASRQRGADRRVQVVNIYRFASTDK